MEPPAPPQPPTSQPTRTILTIALTVAVLGYLWMLRQHTSPFAGGSDSSGYLNSAALVRAGKLFAPVRALPGHAADEFGPHVLKPLGFNPGPAAGLMVPTYPIGLPLHLAALSPVAGLDWATLPLNMITALAAGGLMYALARQLRLSVPLALGGAALLLVSPQFLFSATQPMSDLLSLVWSLATLSAALRARENRRWALATGFALSVAVLIRPTNLLLLGPVALAFGKNGPRYLWAALGGLPGALLLAYYNQRVNGSFLATGYGAVGALFSREFFAANVPHFARWIPGLLSPLAVAALGVPFVPELRERTTAVLALWVALLTGFYACYFHSGEAWWYLRFILPAFPAILLLALAVAQSAAARTRQPGAWLAALLAGALAWECAMNQRLDIFQYKSAESTYPEAASWAREHLPHDAVIASMQVSGAFYYYTDFLIVRWDYVDATNMAPLLRALRESHRPLYAVLYDHEQAEARQRLPGTWTKLTRIRHATIWRVEPAPDSP